MSETIQENKAFKIAIRFLEQNSKQGNRLLDAGCGNGKLTEYFRNYGFKTTGIDINESMIETARKTFPENEFFPCNLDNPLPFPDAEFDCIFSNSVMQYIDWKKTILEYNRILKLEGKVVFVENLQNNPFAVIVRFFKKLTHSYGAFLTPRQHISHKDIIHFKKVFNTVETDFQILLSPLYRLIPTFKISFLVKIRNTIKTGLEKIDFFLISKFPFLRLYCSRLVILASQPNKEK